ncbi:hypothetical protein Back11_38880 [Paenibacillus baekrokdamisoli]|uniref:Peptidase S8/S53 domain-containing protein n=1 Tax=Paenibacillus baekrokdamisoli TaxID=1712516 RepID=A0A3G9JC94_9BACL|nr:S8 family peptidase [Paenibacillus baekrokdamisoli]MBB3068411.1 hypothetical protein [Paenibacillus baekrokdamisoli]BBH22543.1 hypothetical protein Back11_38880 [Paenibacillus baekrokdamisoli]
MKKNNLPIKFFQKRNEVDERYTEGGGSDIPPKWVLQGEELKAHSNELIQNFKIAESQLEGKLNKYKNVPTVIKAKVNTDALAKSHRSEITQLFTGKKIEKTIGLNEEYDLLIRVDSVTDLKEISKKLDSFKKNAKAVSAVENIEAFKPKIKEPENFPKKDGRLILKVKLFNYNDTHINKITESIFLELLSSNEHLQLKKIVNYSQTLKIYEVTTDSALSIDTISDFNAIQSIEPMPMYEVTEDSFFSDLDIEFPEPNKDSDYPIVGILDSGIAPIFELRSWIKGSHSSVPANLINRGHGTFVGGIVAFSDLLEGQVFTGLDGCYLYEAIVIPDKTKDSISEADLIANIREVIEKNKNVIKIWNMSLGTNEEVSDFSDFGIGLDSIQDDNEVLIIKSAGNCNNFEIGKPVSKIARGAESIRAITVGSIAHSQNAGDLVKLNHPSPFSRVGPGPSFIIKPELVHYGGNSGVKNGKAVPNGVQSFGPDGTCRKAVGTSFSTPRVSAIIANLNHKLREDFDPVLLKALILHTAKYPEGIEMEINDKVNQMGFGLPTLADDILYNDPSEITLILREGLNKGEFIEILDFPYPESLIDDQGYFTGQIILTVVNSPIVDGEQGPEYCQSNIDVKFGTYDQKTFRDTTKPIIKNEIGREGGQNLLNSSIFSKKKPIEQLKTFSNSEKMLLQYGNKFYPNKKYAIDLSELTSKNKEKYVQSPKKWYLKIEGLYRDAIEKKAEATRIDLNQEFCMILTIRDPLKKALVYEEVSALLDNGNFIHRDIKLRQAIDARVEVEV